MSSEHVALDVEYSYREGYHVFTSPDLKGFFVANQDAEAAVKEIPEAIKLLVRLNQGIECDVELPSSFDDFLRHVRAKSEPAETVPPPVELGSRTYLLKCA